MQRFDVDGLELEAWRAAWRHGSAAEVAGEFARLAAVAIPQARLIVVRSDGGDVSSLGIEGRKSMAALSKAAEAEAAFGSESRAGLSDRIEWVEQERTEGKPSRGMLPPPSPEVVAAIDPGADRRVIGMTLHRGSGTLGYALLSVPARRGHGGEDERGLMLAWRRPLAMALALAQDRDHQPGPSSSRSVAGENSDPGGSSISGSSRRDGGEIVVGAEGGLLHVMERVQLVARSDVPVLILGETGSGKEVIARAIHLRSRRRKGPFMRVNCGAIPPELIDSELFGHEKGAFTGAVGVRQGWFERSDGGTLFLDEIGELPPAAQVRLLRILQDGAFERVGGSKTMTVDVRIVAATHRDLPAMIDEGTFREDLWYRIATFPVRLPPLRERPEDLPALAAHFAQKAARRFGLHPLDPTGADLELLASYAWPGNVRELAAVMDRAAILGDGQRLEVAKALGLGSASPPAMAGEAGARSSTNAGSRRAAAAPSIRAGSAEAPPPIETLEAAAARHIEAALAACLGRVDGPFGAAAKLGVKPNTLRARMRRLGLDWRRFRPRK